MSKTEAPPPPPPLKIPFTPEGMEMVCAFLGGLARAADAQGKLINVLEDRMGFRP